MPSPFSLLDFKPVSSTGASRYRLDFLNFRPSFQAESNSLAFRFFFLEEHKTKKLSVVYGDESWFPSDKEFVGAPRFTFVRPFNGVHYYVGEEAPFEVHPPQITSSRRHHYWYSVEEDLVRYWKEEFSNINGGSWVTPEINGRATDVVKLEIDNQTKRISAAHFWDYEMWPYYDKFVTSTIMGEEVPEERMSYSEMLRDMQQKLKG